MRRAIFTLNMKFYYSFLALVTVLLFASCNTSPKVVTYQDAENQFRRSLTQDDTLQASVVCQDYMEDLVSGDLESAVSKLFLIENNVLYKMGAPSTDILISRYTNCPVTSYEFISFEFSTPAVNKFVYKYAHNGADPLTSGLKIVLCPVKVEGKWYLTLMNGPAKIHPLAPAPGTVKLHRKQ